MFSTAGYTRPNRFKKPIQFLAQDEKPRARSAVLPKLSYATALRMKLKNIIRSATMYNEETSVKYIQTVPSINEWNYLYSISHVNFHQKRLLDLFDLQPVYDESENSSSSSPSSKSCSPQSTSLSNERFKLPDMMKAQTDIKPKDKKIYASTAKMPLNEDVDIQTLKT